MVFYFVTKKLTPNSLLQRFVDGDDEFRNSRFKLIPSVPKVMFSLLLSIIPLKSCEVHVKMDEMGRARERTSLHRFVWCNAPRISGLMDCPPKRWQHTLSIRQGSWHYLYPWSKLLRSKTENSSEAYVCLLFILAKKKDVDLDGLNTCFMLHYGDGPVQIDVDIGSSTVANGVLGLVCGVITTLVVDMAFLVQVGILPLICLRRTICSQELIIQHWLKC